MNTNFTSFFFFFPFLVFGFIFAISLDQTYGTIMSFVLEWIFCFDEQSLNF